MFKRKTRSRSRGGIVTRAGCSIGIAAWAFTIGFVMIVSSPAALMAAGETQSHVTLDYYRSLAENGSLDAALVLGDMYRTGDGVAVDLVQAYAWYYLAAQEGLEEAIAPLNDVLRALPVSKLPLAKQLAESYEKKYLPQGR